MKKVAFVRAEYNASLPPYRFAPGDVVEIEDDWADQLIRREIAKPAKAGAKTVQQIRNDARPPVPTAADERANKRAALLAELETLDREDAVAGTLPDEGHYDDMLTRGEPEPPAEVSKSSAQGQPRPAVAQGSRK